MTARRLAALSLAALLTAWGGNGPAAAQGCTRPCVGPARGAVMAVGGGEIGRDIFERFLALAGGDDARIVLIPTAGAQDGSHDAWIALERLRDAGASRIEVLHTRKAAVADLDAFTAPLREATGVWISGGSQFRLMQAYLDTRTQSELHGVLARGGVVAGNSAGASALASFLVRGSPEGNRILMAPGRVEGFGLLRGVAVDQHLRARGRQFDLFRVIRRHPDLLGIGIDEGAAVVITRDLAEVIGEGGVAVYDPTDPESLVTLKWLVPGAFYDLGLRRELLSPTEPPPPPPYASAGEGAGG